MAIRISKITAYVLTTPIPLTINEISVKHGGAWQHPDVYCKHGGAWVEPDEVYVKDQDHWIRVFSS